MIQSIAVRQLLSGPNSARTARKTNTNIIARPRPGPLIHHLFLPSLALGPGIDMLPSLVPGPGILLRDDVGGYYNPYVIPAGNAGT
uniref:Uncharacterized protein n=1 Tax=Candidatus Kentrum sp. FW TaxID=2126338 RepID=A0A450TXT7_9GAMM|nr:MAG: hypothetical protein BECKFW1821C_GA0114237_106015 [Candidatus Kentron sp. FW]